LLQVLRLKIKLCIWFQYFRGVTRIHPRIPGRDVHPYIP